MTQARALAGVTAALLVVGAVVHFQPAQKLTADSFVSAALNIDTLAKCEAGDGPEAAGTPGAVLDPGAANTNLPFQGATAAATLMVQTKGPCVCNKNICTNGRVCDPAGALGQCYLPRCPMPDAGAAANTALASPVAYTAGCYCATDASFTSSDKAKAYVGGEVTEDCPAGVATKVCKCGSAATGTSVCYAGDTCDAAGGTPANTGTCQAAGAGAGIMKVPQTYAFAIPSISSNVFTDPAKFQICKSTAATKHRCQLPAAPVTQNGETAPVTCEVVA